MHRAKFNPPLSLAQHIRLRTEEGQEHESGERYEHVVSGAKLVCTGCTEHPDCTGNVILHIECVGDLSNGRPRVNTKHNSAEENFVCEEGVYFGTCQNKQDDISELEELYESDSGESGGWLRRTWNSIVSFFGGLFGSNNSNGDDAEEEIESVDDLSDECVLEFDSDTYWEDYAESDFVDGKVNGERNNANALYVGQSFIRCKHDGEISVIENPPPIIHELISQEMFEGWMEGVRLELVARGLRPDAVGFYSSVPFPWENVDQSFIDNLNGVLNQFGISSENEIAHFLAQTAVETGWGRVRIEEGTVESFNNAYSSRGDLGNQGGNDGFHFRGAGYIQLTGRANYESFAIYQLSLLFPDLVGPGQIELAFTRNTNGARIHVLYNQALDAVANSRHSNVDISRITNTVPAVGAAVDNSAGATAIIDGEFYWDVTGFFWINNVRGWDGNGRHREITPLFTNNYNADALDVSRAVNGNVVTPNHLSDRQVAFDVFEEMFNELGNICPYCGEEHEG